MSSRQVALSFLAPLVLSITAPKCFGLPQGPAWSSDFARPDMESAILDLASFDDGSGPKLYAAGEFTLAGGVIAHHVARWNGARWSPLGIGLDRDASALAVYDDEQGPELYVGGWFTRAGGRVAHGIARWDGATWADVGGGVANGPSLGSQVYALAVYDDGTGRALYAAGTFPSAGGDPAGCIVRWDGSAWSTVARTGAWIQCLRVFDDGSGPALYAGGTFQSIDGRAANNIARWDGTSWSAVGAGSSAGVGCLAVYDDGSGSKLYAGGRFGPAGSYQYPLGRWDGSTWSPVGPLNTTSGSIRALEVFDDGSGPRLGIGYWGHSWSGTLATWDGTQWSMLPARTDAVPLTLAVHDDGTGPALYMAGGFSRVGGTPVGGIARWDGSDWSSLSSSPGAGGASALAMTVFDDGTGPALYAGGYFHSAGASKARHVARWSGAGWSGVGDGPEQHVRALAVHDDGSGPALYAGGETIQRWNGSSWSVVGTGLYGYPAAVYALAVFDDGNGPELYAGGEFEIGGGSTLHQVAKWDGSSWISIAAIQSTGSAVLSLGVFDDGTGPALYAGGYFSSIGGVSAGNLARWDGSAWFPVGGGVGSSVEAMTTFDDGTGPALYVGGDLSSAGGVPVNGVARWDGSTWAAAGSVSGEPTKLVRALAVHDDGSGPALYAGGSLPDPSGLGPRGAARLDGTRWRFLGAGVNGDVLSLASFDAGAGSNLYVGGWFTIAGRHSSQGIGRWK